jgi:hypothetical protein
MTALDRAARIIEENGRELAESSCPLLAEATGERPKP